MALTEMPGHLIRRLHQHATLVFMEKTQAAGFDLTPVQFAALQAIDQQPHADQASIAQIIGYDRATIGGVINRLEKKKWIRRVVCSSDRRARELTLSTQGKRTLSALEPIVQALQHEILKPLNASDYARFVELSQKVVIGPASI